MGVRVSGLPKGEVCFVKRRLSMSSVALGMFCSGRASRVIPMGGSRIAKFGGAMPRGSRVLRMRGNDFAIAFGVRILVGSVRTVSVGALPSGAMCALKRPLSLDGVMLRVGCTSNAVGRGSTPSTS